MEQIQPYLTVKKIEKVFLANELNLIRDSSKKIKIITQFLSEEEQKLNYKIQILAQKLQDEKLYQDENETKVFEKRQKVYSVTKLLQKLSEETNFCSPSLENVEKEKIFKIYSSFIEFRDTSLNDLSSFFTKLGIKMIRGEVEKVEKVGKGYKQGLIERKNWMRFIDEGLDRPENFENNEIFGIQERLIDHLKEMKEEFERMKLRINQLFEVYEKLIDQILDIKSKTTEFHEIDNYYHIIIELINLIDQFSAEHRKYIENIKNIFVNSSKNQTTQKNVIEIGTFSEYRTIQPAKEKDLKGYLIENTITASIDKQEMERLIDIKIQDFHEKHTSKAEFLQFQIDQLKNKPPNQIITVVKNQDAFQLLPVNEMIKRFKICYDEDNQLLRIKCPNDKQGLHFLDWFPFHQLNLCSYDQCKQSTTICRWKCSFCNIYFCETHVPSYIYDSKCQLKHEFQRLDRNKCHHCDYGQWDLPKPMNYDEICELCLCDDCFKEDLELKKQRLFIKTPYDDLLFKLNDHELEKIEGKKKQIFSHSIETDSYYFLSILLMIALILIFLIFQNLYEIIKSCCGTSQKTNQQPEQPTKERLDFIGWVIFVLLIIMIMMIPPIMVIIIQYWCLMNFSDLEDGIVISMDSLFLLKILVIWIFIFLICRKVMQIINMIFLFSAKVYDSIETKTNYFILLKIFYIGCIIFPELFCFFLCWSICYYSMIYIISDDQVIDIIQNFAGFFVLLEFSSIIVLFLKAVNFDSCFDYFVNRGREYSRNIKFYLPKIPIRKEF